MAARATDQRYLSPWQVQPIRQKPQQCLVSSALNWRRGQPNLETAIMQPDELITGGTRLYVNGQTQASDQRGDLNLDQILRRSKTRLKSRAGGFGSSRYPSIPALVHQREVIDV